MNKRKFKNVFIENNNNSHLELVIYKNKKRFILYKEIFLTHRSLFKEFYLKRYMHLMDKHFLYIKFIPHFKYLRNNFFFRKFFLFFVNNIRYFNNFYINLYNLKKVYVRAYDSECSDFMQDSLYHELFSNNIDYFPNINFLYDFICDKYFYERFNSSNFNKSIFSKTLYKYSMDNFSENYDFFFIRSKMLFKTNLYYNNSLLFLPMYNNLFIKNYFMLNEEKEKTNPTTIFLKYNICNDFFILNNFNLNFYFLLNCEISLHNYNIYKFFIILILNNNN